MEPQVEARQSKVTARWTFLSLHLYLSLPLFYILWFLLWNILLYERKVLRLLQKKSLLVITGVSIKAEYIIRF